MYQYLNDWERDRYSVEDITPDQKFLLKMGTCQTGVLHSDWLSHQHLDFDPG
jgi:hypothetical protein